MKHPYTYMQGMTALPVLLFCAAILFFIASCTDAIPHGPESKQSALIQSQINLPDSTPATWHHIAHDVRMRRYFSYIDSLVNTDPYCLLHGVDEYTLIWSNARILDSLVSWDYYTRMEAGEFVADQKEAVILHAGDSLLLPDSLQVKALKQWLAQMRLDLNIPEYILRIYNGDSLLHSISVRVGKNKSRYLELAHHDVDLRTPVGEGEIIRIERNPLYIDPVTGHRYKSTRRDDGKYTALPQIPFLEPVIAGERHGSLLHPTTNLSTLGKAVSNGCVGMRESDAWLVYYHAPLGTAVRFRYELQGADGRSLPDIYGYEKKKKP